MIESTGKKTLGWADFQKSIAGMYEPRFGGEVAGAMADIMLENALEKGLSSTGTQAIAGTTTGGDATTMEALYDEVVSTELSMKDNAVIWNDLDKVPVLEEFVQKTDMNDYGGGRRLGFINPGVPDGGVTPKSPSLKRKGIPVRWVGGTFQTFTSLNSQRTLGLNADPAVGNAAEINSEARLQRLVLNASELVWHGDNDINSLEPYGILEQIRRANSARKPLRLNMKGQPITRDFVPKLRQILRMAGGQWTHLYGAPSMFTDLELTMLDSIRRSDGSAQTLGMYPEEALIRDLGGNRAIAKLREDIFLEGLGDDSAPAMEDAPVRPSAVTVAAASAAGVTNVWGTFLAAGTYQYSVKAVGINGRSLARVQTGTVTALAGEKVNVTIQNADAGTIFFEIYRGNATTREYLGRISAEGLSVGASVVFEDDGEFYPGTSTAVALTVKKLRKANSIHICQLLPTTKVQLPAALMSNQAGWICGFTPRVLNEEHQLVIENVGRYVG